MNRRYISIRIGSYNDMYAITGLYRLTLLDVHGQYAKDGNS